MKKGAARKRVVRNTKNMRERQGRSVGYGKNGTVHIPTVTDRTIQQAMKQQMVPIYDPLFAEGSYGYPAGGNLSPMLVNIYLNEFDQEFARRGDPCMRYADDIVLPAKSRRAAQRLLVTSTAYLEGKLKLTVNQEKSRTVSVFARKNFKYLGFTLGKNGSGIFIRFHPKAWKKMKAKLKELASRKRVQKLPISLDKIKVYTRGWLNYYGIADMRKLIDGLNQWLYHRIRMCIWKHWKKSRTKIRNLQKLGVPFDLAYRAGNCRRGYW